MTTMIYSYLNNFLFKLLFFFNIPKKLAEIEIEDCQFQ